VPAVGRAVDAATGASLACCGSAQAARRQGRAADPNGFDHPAADERCCASDRTPGCPCAPTTCALNAGVWCRPGLLFVLSLELRPLPQSFDGARLPLIVLSGFPAPHCRCLAKAYLHEFDLIQHMFRVYY